MRKARIEMRAGRRKSRVDGLLLILLLALVCIRAGPADAQTGTAVHTIEIRGIINPPAADYLERALREAAEEQASLVIVEIDTPGGLDTSMRQMMRAILASPVPVVVYVGPSGARAASAGLFLLASAHVAAMAPGTNTGAAHPVSLGGEADEVTSAKAVNDAAATIRALAAERGRNTEWVERAVRESVSITADEALELGVIEIVARDREDLLAQLDGRTVATVAGEVTLELEGATARDARMSFGERFLHAISHPDIAFILLSIGSIGIIAELYNPGSFIPGIIGAIALILAFFSLGNLPTNWAGVALMVLAVGLLIAELNTDGTGALGVGSVIAFLLGGLFLFQPIRGGFPPVAPTMRVSPALLIGATAAMAGLVFIVTTQVVRSRKTPIQTGHEQFIGQLAQAREDLNPQGRVWFQGQPWNATTVGGRLAPSGAEVRIVGLEGLTLIVEPVEPGEETTGM
jgi:membrane-bound serine protease (ClpP class)